MKTFKHTQQGAALIVALVILLILTILGVAVMESSVMEERMAGNALNNQRVFQAAESALRQAENLISVQPDAPIAGASFVNQLGAPVAGVYSWWNDAGINDAWWAANGSAAAGTFPGIDMVNSPPRYYIEEYNTVCDTLVDPQESDCTFVFRVTAIAWGGRNSTVLLQSLFSRKF